MNYQMPTPQEVHHGMRALKAVALADGTLSFSERAMIKSAQEVFGTQYLIDELDPITPAELAAGLDGPQLREQMVGALVVMSLIDQDPDGHEATLIGHYAEALGVQSRELKNLRQLVAGHTRLARFDILRRFWAPNRAIERSREEGLHVLWESLRALIGNYENTQMAARYRALGKLPSGTLGREYHNYTVRNEFPLPGMLGASPEVITYHDMVHVLGDYGTTPEEEILVSSFSAGFRQEQPLTFVMFVLCQFHLGLPLGPGVPPSKGLFSAGESLKAMQRGAAVNIDLSQGWSYWDVIEEPVEALRERYNIAPRQRA